MNFIFRYLLRGSDVQYLDRSWLADTQRIRFYEAYTEGQLHQGRVVKDVAACQRDAFWRAVEAKAQPREDVGERLIRFRARR